MVVGQAPAPPWAEAVRGLAIRVLGPTADSVRLAGMDAPERAYEYVASHGELRIAATDGVAAAVALHHFLRERCGLSVGWDTALPLPRSRLPDSPAVGRTARVREGYYLNFCTYSYTMPYWDWPDWEREIDWMALHGITMPLALTGHEAAVHLAYSRLGVADDAIRAFLGGPGYLPFQFMGCVGDLAGPLPASWIEGHRELGARILERERSLGMTPVLPAFTGNVPAELAGPGVRRRTWQGIETLVLDPVDPLYERIGAEVARAQIDLFGTDHWYAADPFIEMIPTEAAFASVVAATLAGIRAADPAGKWLMQSWPFSYQRDFWSDERVTALLDAVPDDRMLVADLWAEYEPQWRRFDGFPGKPWLWCALLNFGGRTDPVADLPRVPAEVDAAIESPNPPIALGLSMEATRTAPVFFELVADQLWHRVDDLDGWLDAFVSERYAGAWTDELRTAWRGLLHTIYDARGTRIFPEQFNGILTKKPSYAPIPDGVDELSAEIERLEWYRLADLADAWDRLIRVAECDDALAAGPLGHDLAEVGIAFMARVADRYYLEAVRASVDQGVAAAAYVDRFLRVFTDLDRMVAARREFTAQLWEAKAVSWGNDPSERKILLDNARRIVTVWGSVDSPLLDDYAGRHWAGIVGGYYRDRWVIWAEGLDRALATPAAAHEADLQSRLRGRAEAFLRTGPMSPPDDLADIATESRRLFTRYGDDRRDGVAGRQGRD